MPKAKAKKPVQITIEDDASTTEDEGSVAPSKVSISNQENSDSDAKPRTSKRKAKKAPAKSKPRKSALDSPKNPFSNTKLQLERARRLAAKKDTDAEEEESDDDFDVLDSKTTGRRIGRASPPAKKKKKEVKKDTDEDDDAEAPKKKKKTAVKKKPSKPKPKAYVPSKGSAPAAILISLYEAAKEEDSFEDAGINKGDCVARAKPYYSRLTTGKNFDEAVKPLSDADMVVKSGRGDTATYTLSEIGMRCALAAATNQGGVEIRDVNGLTPFTKKDAIASDEEDGTEKEVVGVSSEDDKPKKKKRKVT